MLALAPGAAPAQEPPAAVVVTAEVSTDAVSEKLTLAGTVAPLVDSLVASEIDGRVLTRAVENADRVERGQILFELDASRLERDLAIARGERTEVKARLEQALRDQDRAQELRQSEVVAERFLDDARTERAALEGRLAQVEGRIASIKDDLARTSIKAPFTGVVTEVHTEVGEWIRRGDPVVRLADFGTVEIRLEVPERYFPQLSRGAKAPARLSALPDLVIDGTVFAVVPRADSDARTFPVLVRAPNPGQRVGGGMLAEVTLTLSTEEGVLTVPRDALVREAGGAAVYRVTGAGTVELIPVRTGRTSGPRVEVDGDLAAGDRVVVRGNERLQPGQKIVEAEGGGPDMAAGTAGGR